MNTLPPILRQLIKDLKTKNYPRGQTLFYQGDTQHEVAILNVGYIKVYDLSEQGNEKILHIFSSGAVLPFNFFAENEATINWFYSSLTECEVYVISRSDIIDKMKSNNDLCLFLINWYSLEVQELLTRMSSLGKSNAKVKIQSALKFLALYNSKQRSNGWYRVNFPVNHQLLADMSGLTRESAAMIMKSFAHKNIVRNPRQTILEINKEKIEPKFL